MFPALSVTLTAPVTVVLLSSIDTSSASPATTGRLAVSVALVDALADVPLATRPTYEIVAAAMTLTLAPTGAEVRLPPSVAVSVTM